MKNICYTVITNKYDTLKEPLVISKGWRYVCFTDSNLKSDVWDIQPFTGDNREVKIKGHDYFNGITLYIDGNVLVKGDLNDFIERIPTDFSVAIHPCRNCIYEEALVLRSREIWNSEILDEQIQRYKDDGFPANIGLGANRILLRDFSNPIVRDICDLWWGNMRMELSGIR